MITFSVVHRSFQVPLIESGVPCGPISCKREKYTSICWRVSLLVSMPRLVVLATSNNSLSVLDAGLGRMLSSTSPIHWMRMFNVAGLKSRRVLGRLRTCHLVDIPSIRLGLHCNRDDRMLQSLFVWVLS